MASSRIKGITIKIDGDTTKLGKALESVEGSSKKLQSELKGINTQALLNDLNEFIVNVSDQIEVRYPQNYIGYRTTKNFAEVQVQKIILNNI